MAIGYDYRCQRCGHEWMLFSEWFTMGPTQWGESKYTCYTCQTFLSVAKSVDANSWSVWYRNHATEIESNSTLSEVSQTIRNQLKKTRGLTPIELDLDFVKCPTCRDTMSTIPFGQHLMRCAKCDQFTGEFDNGDGISIYGSVVDDSKDET